LFDPTLRRTLPIDDKMNIIFNAVCVVGILLILSYKSGMETSFNIVHVVHVFVDFIYSL